jgi:hypothetical protein
MMVEFLFFFVSNLSKIDASEGCYFIGEEEDLSSWLSF